MSPSGALRSHEPFRADERVRVTANASSCFVSGRNASVVRGDAVTLASSFSVLAAHCGSGNRPTVTQCACLVFWLLLASVGFLTHGVLTISAMLRPMEAKLLQVTWEHRLSFTDSVAQVHRQRKSPFSLTIHQVCARVRNAVVSQHRSCAALFMILKRPFGIA